MCRQTQTPPAAHTPQSWAAKVQGLFDQLYKEVSRFLSVHASEMGVPPRWGLVLLCSSIPDTHAAGGEILEHSELQHIDFVMQGEVHNVTQTLFSNTRSHAIPLKWSLEAPPNG